MQIGVLCREVEFETARGRRMLVRSRRLASLEDRHLAAIDYEVVALDGPARITLSSELVTHGAGADARRPAPRQGLRREGARAARGARRGTARRPQRATRNSGLEPRAGSRPRRRGPVQASDQGERRRSSAGRARARRSRCALSKYVAYHWARRPQPATWSPRVDRTLDARRRAGYDTIELDHAPPRRGLLATQRHRGRRRPGDSSRRCASTSSSCCRRPPAREGLGVPAKGVTGHGYEGHYFWDTEVYVVPFLTHTHPAAGRRQVLNFRGGMLDAARARARTRSATAARCSRGGRSAARRRRPATPPAPPSTTSTPTSRTPCTSTTASPATWRSCSTARRRGARRDRAVLDATSGSSPSAATALLHQRRDRARRVHDRRRQQRLHEPDGAENLEAAAESVEWLLESPDPSRTPSSSTRPALAEPEPAAGAAPPRGCTSPRRRPASCSRTTRSSTASGGTSRARRRSSYPLLLHYHPLEIYRHQVIKQADVVLATYLAGRPLQRRRRCAARSTTTTR